ncbi:septum site-determining protein MinD [Halorubrum alkaliphilum]|uniref:Septum site-determining protein MinD n=1 Tax=Halorubrum alkaliphilum TaxID=261290 RepID=A0A8T4GB10_9EURY|nr:P-loop NTPase [Halorubrum alkaliphilum]MBP1921618.1 septum site-determining protein MinD [Halorubrum alkaliphilum]
MIALAGGKGGSGKTTTTVGLARALSRRGAPVVAVDADWDLPNLAELAAETGRPAATARRAGAETRPSMPGLAVDEVARGSAAIPEDRTEPAVLSAPDRPREVDAAAVFERLEDVLPEDAPVLLDCPAGASPDAAAPLRAADRCVLVTPLRRPAIRDAAKTAALARRLDCPPLGTIVTRARSTPDALPDLLDCPVLARTPAAAPEPLSDGTVRSAYDAAADRLVETYGGDRWRVA